MRSRSASNFSTDDLRKIVATCNEHGIKSYLTVNTVIYNDDLPLMRQIVDTAKEVGVSAIIASDVAVMRYANSIGVEVHLSTQLNIANSDALRFYAQFADVAVLARELNLEQVADIYRTVCEESILGISNKPIRIEMFCHGALCMAVSGKCYLSLHEHNASANRGACMQVCRRAYTVKDRDSDIELDIENQYIMSPKDLKTIHFLNKMIDAGVRVFKIEGRARGRICGDGGGVLPRGDRELPRWHIYRREDSGVGRTLGARVQSRLLERLLLGAAARRMEYSLWFTGHSSQGVCG